MAARAMLRASDADRDTVVERLRSAAAEGRLETEELDERVHAALRARTYGELDTLMADLPSSRPVRSRRPRSKVVPVARTAFGIVLPVLVTAAVIAAVVAAVAIAAAWWMFWAVVWFVMCGRGSCSMRRRVHGTRPAGLY